MLPLTSERSTIAALKYSPLAAHARDEGRHLGGRPVPAGNASALLRRPRGSGNRFWLVRASRASPIVTDDCAMKPLHAPSTGIPRSDERVRAAAAAATQ